MEKSKKEFMRKFAGWLHKEHSVILSVTFVVLMLIIIIVTVLSFLGYKLIVFEDVRPDWEAIGTLFSFIASVGAIGAAIIIPREIAHKQNDIALFKEKYEIFQKCAIFLSRWHYSCSGILSATDTKEKLICCIVAVLIKLKKGDSAEEIFQRFASNDSITHDLAIEMFEFYEDDLFLFPKASCLFQCVDNYQIKKITEAYNDFINKLRFATILKEFDDKFDEATKRFLEEIELIQSGKIIERMSDEVRKLKS